MPPPTELDPAAVRRLIARLRERKAHTVGELRDTLDTAAAVMERQADTIAAFRCDCAERATLATRIEGAREAC